MPSEDLSLTVTRKSCEHCRKDYYSSLGVCPQCGNELIEVKRDPFLGRMVAERYQVQSLIGVGGMGVVYKAWHEALKRPVAIKVLRQQFLNDEMSVKRFKQEAIAASRLAHPNIVSLHDFGSTEDGYLYMVMDLLDGRSLADLEKEKKALGVERTIRIISQVCDALEHAHKNGIVHRDLKPGNIMLMKTDENPDFVKLVDFGIAKVLFKEEDQELTQKGEVFGSPLYMSPEQCLGEDMDGRSDIYALGAVLYEALTGQLPFMGKNMIETIDKQIHATAQPFNVVRPDFYIPERLEAVVLRALSKRPEDRQPTMKDLALELQSAVPRRTQALNLRDKTAPAGQTSKNVTVMSSVIGVLCFVVICLIFALKSTQNAHLQVPSPTVAPAQPTPTSDVFTPTEQIPTVPKSATLPAPAKHLPLAPQVNLPTAKPLPGQSIGLPTANTEPETARVPTKPVPPVKPLTPRVKPVHAAAVKKSQPPTTHKAPPAKAKPRVKSQPDEAARWAGLEISREKLKKAP